MANPAENEEPRKINSNVVSAVTRQFGSLGRPIAREVAKQLGLKFIDREIIEKAGDRMGYKIDELEKSRQAFPCPAGRMRL